MELNDSLGILTRAGVVAVCRRAGLPPPRSVELVGGRDRFALYRVDSGAAAESRTLWVELVSGVRGSALQLASTALEAARLVGELPTLPPFELVDTVSLGRPAAIRPGGPGPSGTQVLGESPEQWPILARTLGAAVDTLRDCPVPRFGLRCERGRFLPARSTWREEWAAYVQALAGRARAHGSDPGPLGRRLLAAIDARLDALDHAEQWCLVHGGLAPRSLERVGQPPGTWVLTGFGDALAGDPLVDAAVLLGMSPEQLGPVLGAVDGDWLDAWLEPEALARIEAYHLSWCLAQICQIGEYYALDHDLHRLANLERVGRHLHLALEPGFAERRLGAARQCAGDVPWVAVGFDAPAARLRVALALLGTDPAPPIEQALSVAGVLGAQLLAARLALWPDAGEQSTRIEACARVGWSTQPVVRPGPHPDCEPLADVDRWSRGLVGDVLRHPHRGGSSALVLLWVGLEALARVDHEVTGAVHRGLERLVRATACTEGLDAASARRRLVHALLGLAALHGLREQLGLPEHDVERRADDLREQLQDASAELDLDWRASPGAPPGLAPLEEVEDWTREQAVQGLDTHRAGQLRPLLVYALCRLHGELALPGGPGWVIERAGL